MGRSRPAWPCRCGGGWAGLNWPVSVATTSGTDSATPKHDMAEEAIDRFRKTGQVTKIGHVGDLDEAGLMIVDALAADMEAFADDAGCPGAIGVEFLALTPAQVTQYNLTPNPGKPAKLNKDGRLWTPPGGTMAQSVQAEALDPDDLLALVNDWLQSVVDVDLINDRMRVSRAISNKVVAGLRLLAKTTDVQGSGDVHPRGLCRFGSSSPSLNRGSRCHRGPGRPRLASLESVGYRHMT